MKNPVAPTLYTIDAAAKRLGCDVGEIYRLMKVGDLRAKSITRTGKPHPRVTAESLDEYIEKRA